MAPMSPTWYLLTVLTALAAHCCTGDKSCVIWSSAEPVVIRGSGFKVFCRFECKCEKAMYVGNASSPRSHGVLNSSTFYLDVEKIAEHTTFSCSCNSCRRPQEPCGLDVLAGYPPAKPVNLSCVHSVVDMGVGDVVCTWNGGRKTYIRNTTVLRVNTTSGNRTTGPLSHSGSGIGSSLVSVKFNVSKSARMISVRVQTHNKLGSAESDTYNFTLSDIVMPAPPVLVPAHCSSRACEFNAGHSLRDRHLEVQYTTEEQAWRTVPDPHGQASSLGVLSVSPLDPYKLYLFRARARFSTGLWSHWSSSISDWTQEEAPDTALDVWFSEPGTGSDSLTVFWKKLRHREARGKVLEYVVWVHDPETGAVNVTADANATWMTVRWCASCRVTVSARNSGGLSPPALLPSLTTSAPPPQDVRVITHNNSVALSWRTPGPEGLITGCVVEWHPQDPKREELHWVRLDRNQSRALITDLEPYECYEGVLYVFYKYSVGRTRFTGVSSLESAPIGVPSIKEQVEGDGVTVSWTAVPRGQRRGCISDYTIYIQNNRKSNDTHVYHIPASEERRFRVSNLPSSSYNLWMTAWTAQGEGPPSVTIKFIIQLESQALLLVLAAILLAVAVLCVFKVLSLHHSIFPDVIDPGNSKWAREYVDEKLSDSTSVLEEEEEEEEEEPVVLDVEELPEEDATPYSEASSSLLCEPSPGYACTAYIQSCSHDSDSSRDTSTTVGYISSHSPEENGAEEEEEYEEEYNHMFEMLHTGAGLTLDAVKIDCRDLWLNW